MTDATGSYYGKPTTPAATLDSGKIFVGGLSWQTTEESLRWHFEQFGAVQSVDVMRDRNTGQPRGFAFVVFADPATVDAVMNEPVHEINHKTVDVKRAQARGVAPPSIHGAAEGASATTRQPRQFESRSQGGDKQGEPSPETMGNKVFVGGIPPHIDKEGLKQIFEQFGAVTDAIVMLDQVTNRSRCFGFVTFENGSNGAQKAIEAQPIPMDGRNVEVKLATPRPEQQKQQRSMPPAGPKHVGLRAGLSSSSSSGEYAGLAVAYGRSGWKAGYGSRAFGKAGWAVQGWEDTTNVPLPTGFSFAMLEGNGRSTKSHSSHEPPTKRARRE